MNILATALFSVLKKILLKMAGEKFLYWLLFWLGDIIVKSTKTTKDDEFLNQLKEITKDK